MPGFLEVAGEPGFEPRQTESESVVLPLHHSPIKVLIWLRFMAGLWKSLSRFFTRGGRRYSPLAVHGPVFRDKADPRLAATLTGAGEPRVHRRVLATAEPGEVRSGERHAHAIRPSRAARRRRAMRHGATRRLAARPGIRDVANDTTMPIPFRGVRRMI